MSSTGQHLFHWISKYGLERYYQGQVYYWRQGSHVPVLGAEGNKDRKKQGKKGKLSFGTIQISKRWDKGLLNNYLTTLYYT